MENLVVVFVDINVFVSDVKFQIIQNTLSLQVINVSLSYSEIFLRDKWSPYPL